jgi:hypothetical protein
LSAAVAAWSIGIYQGVWVWVFKKGNEKTSVAEKSKGCEEGWLWRVVCCTRLAPLMRVPRGGFWQRRHQAWTVTTLAVVVLFA